MYKGQKLNILQRVKLTIRILHN